jgi:hypothetical protein
LGKLARSGQPITDPKDAERVRDYIFWVRRVAWRWLMLFAFFALIDVVTIVVWLASGHPLRFDRHVTYVGIFLVIVPLYWMLLRREWRTAEANGWTLDQASEVVSCVSKR